VAFFCENDYETLCSIKGEFLDHMNFSRSTLSHGVNLLGGSVNGKMVGISFTWDIRSYSPVC
jgi:hypothetical protein